MQTKRLFFKLTGALVAVAMMLALVPVTTATAQPELVNPGLQAGADRLVEKQNADGGWGWPLDGDSALNIIGPIGMGLAQGYLHTGNAAHLTALNNVGSFLTSKTVFSPSDGYLAAQLDEIFGGTTYRDYVNTNFYDKLAAGTYERDGTFHTTATYIQAISDLRSGNMAAWDIGMGLVGAAACGVTGVELGYWIDGTKAEINGLDGGNYYDVLGLAGAVYGLAYVGEDFNPTAGEHAAATNLAELVGILASYQSDNGGFAYNSNAVNAGYEAIQETAYAVLALDEFDRALYLGDLQDAADYMLSVQLGTGGWQNYSFEGTSSTENNEITAEAMWGISVVYPELWVCETGDCGHPGASFNTIQGAIDASPVGGTVYVMPGTYPEKLVLHTPNITVKSTDGRDVTFIDVPVVDSDSDGENDKTRGVNILANMGTVTFDGFTVKNFTEDGIIQGLSARAGTTFHVLNNKVTPYGDYLKNGIQVTGDGSSVIGNVVDGQFLTQNWGSSGVGVVDASNVTVKDNLINGPGDYGIAVYAYYVDVSNIAITGNIIDGSEEGIIVLAYNYGTGDHSVTNIVANKNSVINYPVAAFWVEVRKGAGTITDIDFTENWWGSITGPSIVDIQVDPEEVTYSPWCGDAACTFTVPDENGVIVLDGTYNVPDGMKINVPGLTILLKDGTIIKNSSECFIVNASNTTITTETIGGATCVPTGGDHGIVVAGGLEQIEVIGLEIDGTDQTTGDGIHFLGDIKHVGIVNNFIHNLDGDAVHFTNQPDPAGLLSIQGNLFMDNTFFGVNAPGDLDVAYNAWGKLAGPDSADLPAVITSFEPFTHVDLRLETSGTVYADQVVIGDQITFTVYGNLAHVSGVEFDLTHAPDPFAYVIDSFEYNEAVFDEAGFNHFPYKLELYGYQWVYVNADPPITGINVADTWLFRVTFEATQLGKTWSAGFEGDTNFAFAHEFGDGGPSNHIYAADLVGVDPIEVIALPTLTSADIEGPYVAGIMQEFSVAIDNADGGDFDAVRVHYTIADASVDDIFSLEYYTNENGVWEWLTLTPTQAGNDVVGVFGPSSGFPMPADYNANTLLKVVFMTPRTYQLTATLDDLGTGWTLATLDATIVVAGDFTVTGTVSMQGRTVRSGVPMTLTAITTPVYGPFQEESGKDMIGNLVFTGVNGGTYLVTTNQARYLNLYAGLGLTFDVVNGDVELPPLHLFGGNADWVDNYEIDISDASIVGTDYGRTIGEAVNVNADVNFDEKINIQDLALVGGNFGLTSETAYSGWLD